MKSTVKILSRDKSSDLLDRLNYDIVSIAWLNESTAKSSPRAVLNNYKLLVMLKGQASIYIGKNIYYTKAGDCVLFAPGSLYHAEISDRQGCQFVAINFTLSTPVQDKDFRNLLGLKDVAIYPDLIPENTMQFLYGVFERAVEESEGHYYYITLALKRLVGIVFYSGHRLTGESTVKNTKLSEENIVMTCHRYLINNYNMAVTVEELCKLCNVSQSYLYKCFHNVLGMSTKEFITRTKLDMAARQLLQTDKTVTAIAAENGYSNAYRFSNIFKKAYGISPTLYRRENR